MWNGQTLAVVLPTYNEAASINECIRGFEALGIVDDIVVVDNNAHPDTHAEVASTSARVVEEVVQGYGSAIQRGIAETLDADLVCICEPDGTFDPDDILKLLPFTADVDVVFGSRTVRIFILSGANMGLFLKWGNWAVAKLTEVLFNTVYLSDVGCTYRVLDPRRHRSAATRVPLDRLGVWLRDDAAHRRAATATRAGSREVSAAGGGEFGHRRQDEGLLARPRHDQDVHPPPRPRPLTQHVCVAFSVAHPAGSATKTRW